MGEAVGGTQRGEWQWKRQSEALREANGNGRGSRRQPPRNDSRTQSDAIGRNHLQQVNELRPIDAQIRCAFSTLRIFRRIFLGLVWVHRTRVRLEKELEGLVGFLGRSER